MPGIGRDRRSTATGWGAATRPGLGAGRWRPDERGVVERADEAADAMQARRSR